MWTIMNWIRYEIINAQDNRTVVNKEMENRVRRIKRYEVWCAPPDFFLIDPTTTPMISNINAVFVSSANGQISGR